MCGINGIIARDLPRANEALKIMNNRLSHRGPDDEGTWNDGIAFLGQRRLSIIDLSSAGHQPMVSACGRYVMVFNGEVYNFSQLRSQFQYPYVSNTDSEVVLAAWSKLGEQCVELFKGMFAIAMWDKQTEILTLVRDRMGVKPLYYTCQSKGFAFSSEIRALMASGFTSKEMSYDDLVDYLRYQTVQTPQTILKDVQMLEPGCLMRYHATTGQMEMERYWDLFDKTNLIQPASYKEVTETVRRLFFEAVEKRLVADVPFGAFLSGGIDSSAVVGAMAKVSSHRVRTFNISFAEGDFSEAKYARHIAQLLGTEHTEINLTPQQFLEYLPQALAAMDHPSGDGPNTWVVSKVTKEAGITMALSGLGGDELFAGYAIFNRMTSLENKKWLWNLPVGIRSLVAGGITTLRPGVSSLKIEQLLKMPRYEFERAYAVSRQALMDKQLTSIINTSPLPAHSPVDYLLKRKRDVSASLISGVSQAEMTTYMQNVLLRDSDQMSMAHALEVRVPFMDHDLIEYVLSLPDQYKMPVTPKKLLVDSLPDLLPDSIVNRPKMGFVFPWRDWLKGELFDFADARIKNISQRAYFNEKGVMELWSRFVKGDTSVTYSRIWPLVVLEEWLQRNEVG